MEKFDGKLVLTVTSPSGERYIMDNVDAAMNDLDLFAQWAVGYKLPVMPVAGMMLYIAFNTKRPARGQSQAVEHENWKVEFKAV